MMSDIPIVRIEDNVTPFTNTGVGAANELRVAFKELNYFEMQRNLAQTVYNGLSTPLQPHILVVPGSH